MVKSHEPSTGRATLDTRRAILDQARKRFAESGFDAASVRSITQAADANLGSITYHFGGKEELYVEVLREVVEPLAARMRGVVNNTGSHLDRAIDAVRAFFQHLLEYPDMPPLILQQIATGRPPPSPVMNIMRATLMGLADLVRGGQEEGSIRPGDPFLMALSLVSQPVYMTLVAPMMTHMAARSFDDPAERSALVEHAAAFARAALVQGPPAEEGA